MALGVCISKDEFRIKELKRTSSLNRYAICAMCGRKEENKRKLEVHLTDCAARRTCTWCNIIFKNRGNLFNHISRIHGKKASEMTKLNKVMAPPLHVCAVCPKAYTQSTNLKYHIRREHFNMIARVTEAERRGVNEVWLERVLNSDALVEIRKVKQGMYLMKKVPWTDTEISEPTEAIDLTPLYPTDARKHRVWCDLCQKTYYQRDFKKHVQEKHEHIRRHHCNNCHKKFSRLYQYLQHKCLRRPRPRWREGSTMFVDNITIDD